MDDVNENENDKNDKTGPFIKRNAICPICGKSDLYKRLKKNLFIEQGQDIDLRPMSILRTGKGLEKYHPSLYYMWHCKNCFFTAGYPFFETPTKQTTIKPLQFKEAILSQYQGNKWVRSITDILAKSIDTENPDHYSVIKLYLIAIFQLQQINEVVNKDALHLGRYCLRLAWLYHDILEDKAIKAACDSKMPRLIAFLKNDWKEFPSDETIALKMASEYYQITLSSSKAIESAAEELNLVLLLARINLKLGNLTEARKFIMRGKEIHIKFEEKRKMLLKVPAEDENRLADAQLMEIASQGRRMRMLCDEVQNILENVQLENDHIETEKAKNIIANSSKKTPEKIREILKEQNIQERIINKLIPVQQKKKKFLGLFG